MPLIVISGYPSSGKTTRAKQLQKYLENKEKKVFIISENASILKAGFGKNECFDDSQKEKIIRSDLKSEAIRLLNKENVIILDAANYIKGYRYELFCATKAARTTQCTVYCAIQKEKAWEFNESQDNVDESTQHLDNLEEKYSREIFDALCLRYEEPHGNCRWDSPLFVVFPEDELNFDDIYDALFTTKPLPPNQSTQNPPLSATNYLFELDKITKDIVNDVLEARKIGIIGPVKVKNSEIKIDVPSNLNAIQLNKLRRQFINYSKLHTAGSSLDKIPQLFVQFLNSNCK